MGKWRFTLNTGPKLRKIIEDGDEDLQSCKKTLAALVDCYVEIHNRHMGKDLDDFYIALDTVNDHIAILNKKEPDMLDDLLELGYDEWNLPLQCVNDDLKVFYDLCDEHRIWVGGI